MHEKQAGMRKKHEGGHAKRGGGLTKMADIRERVGACAKMPLGAKSERAGALSKWAGAFSIWAVKESDVWSC